MRRPWARRFSSPRSRMRAPTALRSNRTPRPRRHTHCGWRPPRAEAVGTPSTASEIEPNDRRQQATLLPASGVLSGTFLGTDTDFVDINVEHGLELWDISASGAGASRMTLYDGGDNIVAATA